MRSVSSLIRPLSIKCSPCEQTLCPNPPSPRPKSSIADQDPAIRYKRVPAIPREKIQISFSRSSGPGGQSVNKRSTKVEIRFVLDQADWIPEDIRAHMKVKGASYLNSDGDLILTSMKYRNQDDNVLDVMNKLTLLMREACDTANGRLSKEEERAHKIKRNELKRKKRTLERREALQRKVEELRQQDEVMESQTFKKAEEKALMEPEKKPRDYWSSQESQRVFLLELGSKLGIKEGDFESWYKVKTDDIISNGGQGFLDRHDNSLIRALKTVFSEHKWDSKKFVHKPRNFWADPENQKAFMIELRKNLGIRSNFEKWYAVSIEDINQNGGRGLLKHFNGSPSLMLKTLYPEHPWQGWKFAKIRGRGQVEDMEALKSFTDYVEKNLGVSDLEKWYEISDENLKDIGGLTFSKKVGGRLTVLKKVYPEHPWDESLFSNGEESNE